MQKFQLLSLVIALGAAAMPLGAVELVSPGKSAAQVIIHRLTADGQLMSNFSQG